MSARFQRPDLVELVGVAEDGVSVWLARATLGLSASEFASLVSENRRQFRLQSNKWMVFPGYSRAPRGKVPRSVGVRHIASLLNEVGEYFTFKMNSWCTYEEVSEGIDWPKYRELFGGTELPYFLASSTLEGVEPPVLTLEAMMRCFGAFEHAPPDMGKFRYIGRMAMPHQAAAEIHAELSKPEEKEAFVTLSLLEARLQWTKRFLSTVGPLSNFLIEHKALAKLGLDWGVRAAAPVSPSIDPPPPPSGASSDSSELEGELLQKLCALLRRQPSKQVALHVALSYLNWDSLGWGMFSRFVSHKWGRWILFDQNRLTLIADPPAPQKPVESPQSSQATTSEFSPPSIPSAPAGSTSGEESLSQQPSSKDTARTSELPEDNHDEGVQAGEGKAECTVEEDATLDEPVTGDGGRAEGEEEPEAAEAALSDQPNSTDQTPKLWTLFDGKIYVDAVREAALRTLLEIPPVELSQWQPKSSSGLAAEELTGFGEAVLRLLNRIQAQEFDRRQRCEVHATLLKVLGQLLGNSEAKLYIFGSSSFHLCTRTSDLDLCLILDEHSNGYLNRDQVCLCVGRLCGAVKTAVSLH